MFGEAQRGRHPVTDITPAEIAENIRAWAEVAHAYGHEERMRDLARAASLIENMQDVVDAAQWARNRLERIADDSWHGDGRDFKRSLDGVFLDFDRALAVVGSKVPDHLLRADSKEPSGGLE